jgi:uncharacterized repeat protein (TIGR01451 family)
MQFPSRTLLALAVLALCTGAHAQQYQMRSPIRTLAVQSSTAPSSPTTTTPAAPTQPAAPAPVYSAGLSAAKLDFGGVYVGQVGTQAVSLLNTGNQPLNLGSVTLSDAAFNATMSCGSALAVGASCPIEVHFQPLAGQDYTGSVSITANVSNSPLVVTLAGTGLQALTVLSADTSSDFGQVNVGQSVSRTFTLANNGNTAATNVAATLAGSSGLSLTNNTCGTASAPATVQAGGSCTMTVTYTPTVAETLSNASLSVASSATGSPATRGLTGSSVVPKDPYWSSVAYLMHMDGANNSTAFTDAKGNGVTRYGTPVISTAQSKFGGASAQFGTTGSAVSLPSFSPAGSFTIEAWVYIGSNTPASALIDVGGIANLNWQPQAIYYGWPTAGQMNWLASSANTGTDISGSNGIAFGAPVMNAWNHFAVVRDAAAQQYNFYLNGVRTYSLSSSKTPFTSSYRVYLGNYPSGSASGFSGAGFAGYMDEVRFTNGVARYSGATYTTPTQAFPNQ